MKMISVKCSKCGKSYPVNSELSRCMCPYCGEEKRMVSTMDEKKETIKPDDPNEVAKCRSALKMSIVCGAIAFVMLFLFRDNIVVSLVVLAFLCLLVLRDARTVMKNKEMMQRHGMQRGNIVGAFALTAIDIALWTMQLVSQWKDILRF